MARREDMLLGTIHYQSFPWAKAEDGSLLETMRWIVDLPGIGAVEMGKVELPSLRRELRSVFSSHNTRVCYSAGPSLMAQGLSLCDLDEGGRRLAVREVIEHLDQAVEVGAQTVGVVSGRDPGADARTEAQRRLVESLDEICGEAEARDLSVTMELFDRDVQRKMLMGPSWEAAVVASHLRGRRRRFGLVVDLSHLPLQHESAENSIALTAPYLACVHIGNCVIKDAGHKLWGDTHPPLGIDGGENGFEEVVRFLEACVNSGFFAAGFRRPVIIEVRPPTDAESREVFCSSVCLVQEAWARVCQQ